MVCSARQHTGSPATRDLKREVKRAYKGKAAALAAGEDGRVRKRDHPFSHDRHRALRRTQKALPTSNTRAYGHALLTKKRKAWRKAHRFWTRITVYPGAGRWWSLPWAIVACESGGDFGARNRTSTAGGYGQAIDSTWRAYGGSPNRWSRHPAAEAPPAEQHIVFARIWDGGAGRSHWVC